MQKIDFFEFEFLKRNRFDNGRFIDKWRRIECLTFVSVCNAIHGELNNKVDIK